MDSNQHCFNVNWRLLPDSCKQREMPFWSWQEIWILRTHFFSFGGGGGLHSFSGEPLNITLHNLLWNSNDNLTLRFKLFLKFSDFHWLTIVFILKCLICYHIGLTINNTIRKKTDYNGHVLFPVSDLVVNMPMKMNGVRSYQGSVQPDVW